MIKKAFTLVELIIVIAILSILATIGYNSYSGYISTVRDTNRISQLKNIGEALSFYSLKSNLPIPEEHVTISTGTGLVGYQGYIGKDTLNLIGYNGSGIDPLDNRYFSYYLAKDKKYYQLLAYLEDGSNITQEGSFGFI